MKSNEIRANFLEFFKARGHAIIPSASLVPENDPTVLFNTAGMQPIVPYLMGEAHPEGKRLVDSQKCVRTGDLEDIGDNTHLSFFEMLGNWSLGDYFKEDAIKWSYDFLFSKDEGLGLDKSRLYVTVFEGDENAKKDLEAFDVWKKVGIPEHRIYFKNASANWWPAVKGNDTWTGPTGPCSEMFYDITEEGLGDMTLEEYNKADSEQKVVEIWNDVFMQFEKKDGKIISELKNKNVDTGAGLERLCMVLQKKNNVFDTDLFLEIMNKIEELSTEKGKENKKREKRVIADHIRTATFLISDGVYPKNTDQGYVLRRIIRRAVRFGDKIGLGEKSFGELSKIVIDKFGGHYNNLKEKENIILETINKEEEKFRKTLQDGLKEFEKGTDPFVLFSSYGFPIELTEELAQEKGLKIDRKKFDQDLAKHQELSRAGAEKKFKGGLSDESEMVLKYHTATHLLHQALRDILGSSVSQKGSNITSERLRFDFAFDRKMTDEEKKMVEEIVNSKIQEKLPMQKMTLKKEEALKTGALHFFGEKYGESVDVYFVGKDLASAYSKEFCGGPHVENTGTLGKFKIAKEEAVSAGVRRIKATLS